MRQLLLCNRSSARLSSQLPSKTHSMIPDEVAPFNRYLGIFLPYTPLHYLLLADGSFKALVMTSGNLSEEPIAIDNREAINRLGGLADSFLVHDRDILLRCDDSVVRAAGGVTRQLRRSRGFVPVPVFLKDDQPSVLAVGRRTQEHHLPYQRKARVPEPARGRFGECGKLWLFHEAIEHLERILEIRPEIIAYDLHPAYFSTKWALAAEWSEISRRSAPPRTHCQLHGGESP